MPFDPDAYLASKKPAAPSAGGFDPDAYLASKKPAAPAPQPPKTPERTALQTAGDMLNVPKDVILPAVTGAVAAPIANVAGLAATGYEALTKGGKGDGEMPGKFRDAVQRKLTYQPDNPTLRKAGEVAAPAVDAVRNVVGAVKDWAKGGASDADPRGMAVNAGAEGVKQSLNFVGLKGAQAAPGVARVLSGETAAAARSEAIGGTRRALSDVEAAHGRTQATAMTEAHAYEDAAARTQRHLDAVSQRTGTPTADIIGDQVRSAYTQTMDAARAARQQAVDPLYARAREVAAEREATGARVNIQPAVRDLDEMLRLSENIPDLHNKLLRLRQSVEAVPPQAGAPAPVGRGPVSSRMTPPRPPAPAAAPLTYEQLDMASRYIKDIAFSGEAEGYGALIRNTAKQLSLALDRQISEFVPEHAAATARYRELSAPMETMATRMGEALHETEGGLRGEAYSKVPSQDLPGRIFGKSQRVEQLVDALAGGQQATPAARAAAQARVDTWVENWILDAKRSKVGDAARVEAPGQRAALQAAPGAAQRLDRTWGAEQAQAARVPELRDAAEAARKQGYEAALAKQKISSLIERADIDLAHGSAKDAFNGYKEVLRANLALTDRARYKAAIELIDRAATEEQRMVLARRLAKGLAAAAGVGAAYKLGVQVPGMMQ